MLERYREVLQLKDKFDFTYYAFQSRKGVNEPVSSVQSWRILKKAFSEKVYRSSGNDIVATQVVMGHKDPVTTLRYLAQNQEKLDEAVLCQ